MWRASHNHSCVDCGTVRLNDTLKPRLHDTTGCQTGCTNGFDNRFDNRVERTAVRSTGCQTVFDKPVWQTRFDNPVERTTVHSTWLSNWVVQPVWQPVVSCKWGFRFTDCNVAPALQAVLLWWYASVRRTGAFSCCMQFFFKFNFRHAVSVL